MERNQQENLGQDKGKESFFGEPIFVYTSEQAAEDGVLFDVTTLNPEWKKGMFNYVTVNLLNCGYMNKEGQINIPNLLDLLNQAQQIVKKGLAGLEVSDSFFSGSIELPNGNQQEIFIGENETGKLTIMLPEDN